MYGLAPSTNLDFLIGVELEQVAFSLYQLILRFSEETSISIEGTCRVLSKDGKTLLEWHSNQLSDLSEMGRLWGHQITHCSIPGDGSVLIHFDHGVCLEVLDSKKDFESYQITKGSDHIIV